MYTRPKFPTVENHDSQFSIIVPKNTDLSRAIIGEDYLKFRSQVAQILDALDGVSVLREVHSSEGVEILLSVEKGVIKDFRQKIQSLQLRLI